MIAYISPLVPKRTGIALYSHHLIKALQSELESISVFDDGVLETNRCQSDYQAKELLPLMFEERLRQQYSHFIFHFGNNPAFHLPMLHLLQRQKGIVVLHDTVLYYLLAGQGRGGLWQALKQSSYNSALQHLEGILAECPEQNLLRYPFPERYPCLQSVLSRATAIVVHSNMAADYVLEAGYKNTIHTVPLIDYQQTTVLNMPTISNQCIKELAQQQLDQGIFIIGLLGFGGSTKRSTSVLRALSALPVSIQSKIKLMIIGSHYYDAEIRNLDLENLVTCTGFVSDDDYDQGLTLCDLVINLRYPSMGETSAVQVQAMSAKKATLVSNYGWFSELPDDTVHKISVGEHEIVELTRGIIKLFSNPSYKKALGTRAQEYVFQHHSPKIVVNQWRAILSAT